MPFPPTFTNVWDITQPPDTQAANLLGLDLRNLKNDIMQRMSLLSGLIANRPTPEIVNATWGGAGFGLIYFATDTGVLYQWNGATWVVIAASFSGVVKFSDFTLANFTNPAGVTNINTVTVPATFNTGNIVTIRNEGAFTAIVAGSPNLGYTINGNSSTLGQSIGVSGAVFIIDISLMALSGVLMSYSVGIKISGPPGGALNNQVFNAGGTLPYVTGVPFTVITSENAAFTGTVISSGMSAVMS